jgi:hypothetical protein
MEVKEALAREGMIPTQEWLSGHVDLILQTRPTWFCAKSKDAT